MAFNRAYSEYKEIAISSRNPAEDKLTTRKLLEMAAVTAVAVIAGFSLALRFGPVGYYLPLLIAVILNAWLGGFLPALVTEVAGAVVLFIALLYPFSQPIPASAVRSLLGFVVLANLAILFYLLVHRFRSLQRTSAKLELLAQATHDCIWDWDLKAGYVWRSGRVTQTFGCSEDQVLTTIAWWRAHVDASQESRVWDSLQASLNSNDDRWSQEYRLRREDGSFITVADRARIIRDKQGRALRLVGGITDISAERRAEERLVQIALHDPLTGFPNREVFLDRLGTSLNSASKSKDGSLAVLLIDLDRFKVVNDTFGRQTGDELLTSVSKRLRRFLRPGDLAARLGGDEFTLLLNMAGNVEEARQTAEQILLELTLPFDLASHHISVSACIGLAVGGDGPPEELLRNADLALHQAKRQGRGQYRMFDPVIELMALNQAHLESELRTSFEDRSLRLYYQPILSLATGTLNSFEALLRWQHPQRGLILPSEILPVADAAGLSIQLGQWVLREACNQLRLWQQAHPGTSLAMNVNLSGAEFVRPALIDEVKHLLDETGVSGESLIIELTETTIMESNIDAARRLTRLRDMGIRLALDDFGKGHSSLGRLQDFPISILKIDSYFVQRIGEGKRQILDAIIALAHELQLEITAEGIETQQQLLYLREKGAAKVQGVFFAPALSPESANELLVRPPWNFPELFRSPSGLSTGTAAG